MSTVLVVDHVRRVHGRGATQVAAIADVSLEVGVGEMVAVMGPSGSGKSTLLNLAGGLDAPTGGTVSVEGRILARLSPGALARLRRRSVGYVFQALNLIPSLTAVENVMLPLELDGASLRAARTAAAEALAEVGLAGLADRYPDDLSGGQQQRVAIARAVVGDRRLILADEPTGALDSHTGEEVLRLLRARCDAGAAGLLVTHDARHAAWAGGPFCRCRALRPGRCGVALSDPIAAPLAPLVSGHLPSGPGEAVITPYVARQTGAHVGGVLRTATPNRSFRVVGIATSPSKRRDAQAWTAPSAVPSPAGTTPNVDYLAVTRRPVIWAAVRRLNAAGFVVQSRYVDEHPPPPSAVHFQGGPTGTTRAVDAVIALVAGLGLLEIVLLAGPAFAVMGRRLERTLALLAAAGGTRAALRAAVLANAVLLGALAGLGSVVVATVAVRVAEPLLGLLTTDRPGPLGVRPSQLALIAAVGVVTALAAAWMPARTAGRTDVVAALAARRPRDRARLHVPIIAVAVAGLGVAVALLGATDHRNTGLILAGVALMELGLVVATPTLLVLVTGVAGRLPLAPRLALRDAGRNRSSAAPATAAVMAAVIGCVAALIAVNSHAAAGAASYRPSLPYGDVLVQTARTSPVGLAGVANALRNTLPASSVVLVETPGRCTIRADGSASGPGCGLQVIPHVPAGQARTTRDTATLLGTAIVAGPHALPALTGEPAAALTEPAAALAAGKALVVDNWALHAGRAGLDLVTQTGNQARTRTVTVPAALLSSPFAPAEVILPPPLAQRLGIGATPPGVLAATTRLPTSTNQQALLAALVKVDLAHPGLLQPPPQVFTVESGYHQKGLAAMLALILLAALVAIAAAAIATGLANADRTDDLRTLDAVGANPRTRRMLSASRAAVVAGLGALLGTIAGFVPAVAYIIGTNASASPQTIINGDVNPGTHVGVVNQLTPSSQLHLVVPWGLLAIVIVGLPLVAALLAGTLSRARLPITGGRPHPIP